MASSDTSANDGVKTSTKRTRTSSATSKPRPAARSKASPTPNKSSVRRSDQLPKWLTLGAAVTGAVVAVGATVFATRNEWLPRARKIGEWVENSVSEQLDDVNGPNPAPQFEPSGAKAGFDVVTASR
jgi:hypothetical protein